MSVTLPPDYRPTDDEHFMNDIMREYFRQKLLAWQQELLADNNDTRQNLTENGSSDSDMADRAAKDLDQTIELRTRDRERKLLKKIDEALHRLTIGNYGYCAETNEPIGVRRLEARLVATLGLAAQERHEERGLKMDHFGR